MTYTEILTDAWNQADDTVKPYLWSDDLWISYVNTVLDELCERTQLLIDSIDTDICQLSIISGTASYALSNKIITVLDVWNNSDNLPLDLYNTAQLNAYNTAWRSITAAAPTIYALDVSSGYITFVPKPTASATIKLRVVRTIKEPATSTTLTNTPEIPVKYHHFLRDGILYHAYNKNDAETRDPAKIAYYKGEWERWIETIYMAEKRYQHVERVISPNYGNI